MSVRPLHNDTPAPAFGERYAYVLWLRSAGRIHPEGDNDVAAGAGITRQWLQKWRRKNQAPNERLMTRNLVRFLETPYGWALEDWLLDGVGGPPRPDLWAVWSAARAQLLAANAAKANAKSARTVETISGVDVPRPSTRSGAASEKKRRPA